VVSGAGARKVVGLLEVDGVSLISKDLQMMS
jgi:hypothetical protein